MATGLVDILRNINRLEPIAPSAFARPRPKTQAELLTQTSFAGTTEGITNIVRTVAEIRKGIRKRRLQKALSERTTAAGQALLRPPVPELPVQPSETPPAPGQMEQILQSIRETTTLPEEAPQRPLTQGQARVERRAERRAKGGGPLRQFGRKIFVPKEGETLRGVRAQTQAIGDLTPEQLQDLSIRNFVESVAGAPLTKAAKEPDTGFQSKFAQEISEIPKLVESGALTPDEAIRRVGVLAGTQVSEPVERKILSTEEIAEQKRALDREQGSLNRSQKLLFKTEESNRLIEKRLFSAEKAAKEAFDKRTKGQRMTKELKLERDIAGLEARVDEQRKVISAEIARSMTGISGVVTQPAAARVIGGALQNIGEGAPARPPQAPGDLSLDELLAGTK